MPYWNDPKYQHLLVPSIFAISINNIKNNIKLFEEYGIGAYITTRCLRRKTSDLEKLLEYLVSNDIDLVNDKLKLNPILSVCNSKLKERYGIDIKKIKFRGISK